MRTPPLLVSLDSTTYGYRGERGDSAARQNHKLSYQLVKLLVWRATTDEDEHYVYAIALQGRQLAL